MRGMDRQNLKLALKKPTDCARVRVVVDDQCDRSPAVLFSISHAFYLMPS